jgi:ArsR family transcriptional regulator
MTGPEQLAQLFDALSHPVRVQVLAQLASQREYVSELARILGISRPLLYMHLQKLEAAGLVRGNLQLSDDGKAMKFYEIVPFQVRLSPGELATLDITQVIRFTDAASGPSEAGQTGRP